jgi:hypothetical protein
VRGVLLLWIAIVLAMASTAPAAGGSTSLRIALRTGPKAPVRVTTVRCNPPGGTIARPAAACRRLESLGREAFAPTPPGVACSQIYGGPQTALVTGTLDGRRVWARFTRRDGCAIARWNRVAFLFTRA